MPQRERPILSPFSFLPHPLIAKVLWCAPIAGFRLFHFDMSLQVVADGTSGGRGGGDDNELLGMHEELCRTAKQLSAAVRLPVLDVALLYKYLMSRERPPGLALDEQCERLDRFVTLLGRHKSNTLHVLAALKKRHAIVEKIKQVVKAYRGGDADAEHQEESGHPPHVDVEAVTPSSHTPDSNGSDGGTANESERRRRREQATGCLSTLEAQALALRLLAAHQRAAHLVVEAVQAWRSLLSRPFPFLVADRNVLLDILDDVSYVAQSPLGGILPIRMKDFPLLSNVPSIGLFGDAPAAVPLTYPLKKRKPSSIAPTRSLDEQAMLESAEAYLQGELDRQVTLHKELLSRCVEGRFVVFLKLNGIAVPQAVRTHQRRPRSGRPASGSASHVRASSATSPGRRHAESTAFSAAGSPLDTFPLYSIEALNRLQESILMSLEGLVRPDIQCRPPESDARVAGSSSSDGGTGGARRASDDDEDSSEDHPPLQPAASASS